MKRLFKGRKHLGVYFGNIIPLQTINSFNYNHLKKPTITFPQIGSVLLIVIFIVKLKTKASNTKQKCGQSAKINNTSNCTKKS